jgi:NitT/TauT family transport system ATP-binding protein
MSATRIVVGFMPLLDCASLAASVECGFAAAEGLEVRLVRESSWANIRDRLIVGQFQAAHMLAPMSVACSLGAGHLTVPVIAPLALGTGGNAITVSTALYRQMRQHGAGEGLEPGAAAAALRAVVDARAASAAPPLTFAMVYPFSAHNYELRYWLAAAGIDPDQDVRLVVIPPPLLVDAIRAGQIDGFCAGEPWSSVVVEAGAGRIVTTGSHIWPSSAEKVLGLRADWAAANAAPTVALVRAVLRAALWCEDGSNREELARLLAGPRYVGEPAPLLRRALAGELCLARGTPAVAVPEFLRLARGGATFPWPGHALWFYTQMVRWRQIEPSPAAARVALDTYRPQLYRQAAAALPIDIPRLDLKPERFFDGSEYDPSPDSAGHQRGAA